MRAVALLRGVNVGGVRFTMADLAAALEQTGFSDVRTVLASGNVILSSDRDDPGRIAEAVATVIDERFGFDVAVIVVSTARGPDRGRGVPVPARGRPARLRRVRGRGRGARRPRRRGR